jgi:hypothetical protein
VHFHPCHLPAIANEVDRVMLHLEIEAWVLSGLTRNEIQEVPLRHECDELAMGREVTEIGGPKGEVSEDSTCRG